MQSPKLVLGVQLQNVSLRMLHKKRQSAVQRPFVKALQTVLRTTPLGKVFFSQIATKRVRQLTFGMYAFTMFMNYKDCVASSTGAKPTFSPSRCVCLHSGLSSIVSTFTDTPPVLTKLVCKAQHVPIVWQSHVVEAHSAVRWCLQGVKNVLSQAYADATQVTDELVECILQPGLQVSLMQYAKNLFAATLPH